MQVHRLTVLFVLVALLAPASAFARPSLGVLGNTGRFDGLTGQHTQVGHIILGWEQGYSWGSRLSALLPKLGETPMVALNTGRGWPNRSEAITPRDIAYGKGDAYLVALNRALADFGQTIYLRPFGEMNGHWNYYCAFTPSGASKGAAHSTSMFRRAFARVYLTAHGGTAVNARLARLGLPPVRTDLAENALVRVIWNPQGYGSPNIPANSAQAYYPGDAYVDVVGNDLYNIHYKAEWAAAEKLYRAHASKPYAFPEWGNWGIDDPAFVQKMGAWVRSHRRVELLAWFESRPGSIFDLASKPRSLAAYKRFIVPLGR
jgi:Glycosyl hydrolase family 26